MRKSAFIAVLLLAVAGQTAMGVVIPSVSYSANWSFGLAPGQQTIDLPKFDPTLGTLTKVTLIIDSTVTAAATAENDKTGLPGTMGMRMAGWVQGNAPSLDTFATFESTAAGVAVTESDGTPGSGPDFHDFGTLTDVDNKSASSSAAGDLLLYTGPGNFSVLVQGDGGFTATGVSDATIQYSNFGASGVATIVYEYTPEPASLLSLLASGLVFFRRRR